LRGVSLIALAFAVLLLLPGCFGGSDRDRHDDGAHAPARGLSFTEPVVVGMGATGETFVAAGPGGLILACSHGGFSGPSQAWASRDSGATWGRLEPSPSPVPSGDCDVEVSPAGAWAVLYDWVGGASIAVSRDEGATWSVHHGIAPPVTGVVDRPWMAFVGERLLLSYKGIGQGPGIVVVRTSDDDGANWSTPQVVSLVSDPTHANHIGFDFLVGADGVVRIPLVKYDNDPAVDEPFSFLVSRDQGDSWTEEPALGPRDADVLVGAAVAGDGTTLYWAWHDDAGSLWTSSSVDDGATWSDPVFVVEAQFVYTPALAGRPDGTATLVWMQTGRDFAAAARLDARLADPVVAMVVLEGPSDVAQSAEFMDVAHDEDGHALVVYGWDPGDGSCADAVNPLQMACVHFVRET
jgi:hypothetical protein